MSGRDIKIISDLINIASFLGDSKKTIPVDHVDLDELNEIKKYFENEGYTVTIDEDVMYITW